MIQDDLKNFSPVDISHTSCTMSIHTWNTSFHASDRTIIKRILARNSKINETFYGNFVIKHRRHTTSSTDQACSQTKKFYRSCFIITHGEVWFCHSSHIHCLNAKVRKIICSIRSVFFITTDNKV